ncbi:MAG: 4Fe-4S dicluster domain-containing protein [Nitrospinota bacterium]|nr:4Fe-4S dicluster domain-containing protein [Nitrospinota bacterium]
MPRWGMVIDLTKCVGCDACTVACKLENRTPGDIWYAPVVHEEEGTYPNARMVFLPMLCMHCEDAPCAKACPTLALKRRPDGIIMYEEEKCCGSRACVTACPYDAAHFFEGETGESLFGDERTLPTVADRGAREKYSAGTVQKCTFCAHRVDSGASNGLRVGIDREATPACVVTCPAECRIFGDLDDPKSNVSRYLGERGKSEVLRPAVKTNPKVLYVVD